MTSAQSIARAAARPAQTSRVLAMDGIRGIGCTFVFLTHYRYLMADYLQSAPAMQRGSEEVGVIGRIGLDCFFLLSGFLIYGSLINPRRPLNWSSFMAARLRRIYPPFLAVLLIHLVLSLVVQPGGLPPGLWKASAFVLANTALLPGLLEIKPINPVQWTLSYEIFFYAAVPIFVIVLRMRSWRWEQRAGLAAAVGLAYLGFCAYGGRELLFTLLRPGAHVELVFFLVGIVLYEVVRGKKSIRLLPKGGEVFTIALCAIAFGVASWADFQDLTVPAVIKADVVRATVLCVCLFFFGFYSCFFKGALNRMLSWPALTWLGSISYSYYLLHGLIVHGVVIIVRHFYPPVAAHPVWVFWLAIPIAYAVTVAAGYALFISVEYPFALPKSEQRRAAPTAVAGAS